MASVVTFGMFESAQLITSIHIANKHIRGATGFLCLVTAYFYLPEMKGRSYREIDIMFKRRIPARQWKKTVIDVQDDE